MSPGHRRRAEAVLDAILATVFAVMIGTALIVVGLGMSGRLHH